MTAVPVWAWVATFGVLAVLIVLVALWRKLRLEERWMIETFGDAYLRYRDEVRALIPFVL